MDYEKLYKEAKQRAIDASIDGFLDAVAVEEIFHELKESGDERIRKAIICYIGYGQHCGVSNIDMIAWLEKQSKENMIEALRMEYEKGKADGLQEQRKEWTSEDLLNRNEIADILQEYNRDDLIGWLEKQGEQVIGVNKMIEQEWGEEDERVRKSIIELVGWVKEQQIHTDHNTDGTKWDDMIAWLEKQNKLILANSAKTCKDEQKLSNLESIGEDLSKEDEVKINRIVGFIENLDIPDNDILRKDAAWLKSLKERVQPKQEWDKEDEKEWNDIIKKFTWMEWFDELDFLRHKLNR